MSTLAKMKLRSIKNAMKRKPRTTVQCDYIQCNQSYGLVCQETTREVCEGKNVYIALRVWQLWKQSSCYIFINASPYRLEAKQYCFDTCLLKPTETSSTDGYEEINSEEEQVEHTEQQVYQPLPAKAQQLLPRGQAQTTIHLTPSDEEDSSDEDDTVES